MPVQQMGQTNSAPKLVAMASSLQQYHKSNVRSLAAIIFLFLLKNSVNSVNPETALQKND